MLKDEIKPEQVPNAVAQAAHDVFWNAVYEGKPIDLEIEFDRLFYYAIAAALNAWPGMRVHRPSVPPRPPAPRAVLILPLTEKPNAEA